MRDYRRLKVWEKAHRFVLDVYRSTQAFPPEERFGLTREVRRSATSIPSNIAEGSGRQGDREYARFLSYAAGSASEADYQLLLARDLGYLDEQSHSQLDGQAQEVKRILNSFIQRLSTGAKGQG